MTKPISGADIIEIGSDLNRVKDALPHGQFGRWLTLEFGWTEQTARNFMGVSEQFGKTEVISDLRIQPTAAYLLSAPSAPEEARHQAIERAEAGEQITTGIAKEILSKCQSRLKRGPLSRLERGPVGVAGRGEWG